MFTGHDGLLAYAWGAADTMGGFTRSQIRLIIVGVIAMILPLCFIIIIFAINFGDLQ